MEQETQMLLPSPELVPTKESENKNKTRN